MNGAKKSRFGGFIYARNFPKFQQSKDIMKTGKSTSDLRFRVLPPFFRDAKKFAAKIGEPKKHCYHEV
jgi:hypothetical protein